jgi:hypothetical protein
MKCEECRKNNQSDSQHGTNEQMKSRNYDCETDGVVSCDSRYSVQSEFSS